MRLNLDMIKYWIPELRKIPEFRELAKVWEIEFKKLYECTQKTLDDTFIDTASEDGIKRLEKIAGIYPDEGDSLKHRRTRLYSYWNDRKPYTEGELYNRLKALCGSSDFEIKPDYRNFLIQIITHVGGVGVMEEIEYMLDYFIPANLIVELKNILTGGSAMAIVLLGIIIICTVAQKLFFKYAFDDGTSDESRAAVRKRKKAEKAAKKAAGKSLRGGRV